MVSLRDDRGSSISVHSKSSRAMLSSFHAVPTYHQQTYAHNMTMTVMNQVGFSQALPVLFDLSSPVFRT